MTLLRVLARFMAERLLFTGAPVPLADRPGVRSLTAAPVGRSLTSKPPSLLDDETPSARPVARPVARPPVAVASPEGKSVVGWVPPDWEQAMAECLLRQEDTVRSA